jgi:hypothetical protein
MVRQHALMESLSASLHGFLHQINGNLSRPDQKFLQDALIGLLRAGRPIVCQMARQLPNQRAEYTTRVKRLDAHLVNPGDFDQRIKETLPELWLPLIQEDTPIILDLSDLAKPLARKMDYLATVRDGSTGQLVNGYWLVEIYASVGPKNPIPVLLEPFSHEQPLCRGQNPVVIDAVRSIFAITGNRGVLVIDRGGDAIVLFSDWLDHSIRFVARLRGDRNVLGFYHSPGGALRTVQMHQQGQWIPIEGRELAERTPTPYRWSRVVKRRGKVIFRFSQIGWVKVRLPGRSESLTMVVSRVAGHDVPFMLLTNLPVESPADAQRVLRYYIRRWECEEGMQFLKEQVNLESIRTFRWSAICRLVLLAVLVMIYLAWLVEKHPRLTDRLIEYGQVLPNEADFLFYRLLTGVTEAINACFYLRRYLP